MSNCPERIPSVRHESPKIERRICNGCLRLEIVTKQTKHGDVERYYCRNKQHGYFDPSKVRKCELAIYDTHGVCKNAPRGIVF